MSEYSAPMQFIDLNAQQKKIRQELEVSILRVLDHGQYIMGPEVKVLESNLKEFTQARHAITCANGTDALSIVLMAWGIGPGHAVFVPSFTYVATAESPAQLGATPFLVDVDVNTFNIDPDSFKQAIIDCKKIGLKPSVVIAVDLFGKPADIDEISSIAKSENIKVLVDGAQSFGASLNGRRVGTMGDATTTSFFPAKPLGCYGDGGAIFSNNDEDAALMNSIRLHGKGSEKYDNVRIGLNSRMDTIQAAILIEKLKIYPEELKLRNIIAKKYNKCIDNPNISLPIINENFISSWAQYTVRIHKDYQSIREKLSSNGIPTVVYYPLPLCMQKGYESFPKASSGTKISKLLSSQVLSFPMHPYLDLEIVNKISKLVNQ